MNNFAQSFRHFASRLTPLSWVLIILLLGLLIMLGVKQAVNTGNSDKTTTPVVNDASGLIENVDDLSPVVEGEDATGEILPPNTLPPTPEADSSDFSSLTE